ncbi:uncharacterized protein BT62DRAFT_920621 [Guyanagaster necrorhizus]|uniref:F-box domain-containing protein n=1 Tax=Guyanagaster necrorhizus TaxID=856835 RepID=A0A9P7VQ76_9AGAR|nr:uncharacterized protein BT62DRAFT_920621 [Guyanagaster necrorhizus MCA 3950]KAG7445396.1 hypothetical protein BT62DRAFT_920621 [Guyanagaster necrorhizus MCA 3950]
MPELPQEIIDEIIDELRSSKSATLADLKSCSLVSRAFVPRTRGYMFRSVELRTCRDCERFLDMCHSSSINAVPVPPVIVALLLTPSQRDPRRMETNAALVEILTTYLRNLRHLTIQGWTFPITPSDCMHAFTNYPFTSLALQCVTFHAFCDVIAFIKSFPTLRHLTLLNVEVRKSFFVELERYSPPIPYPLQLDSLSVSQRFPSIYESLVLRANIMTLSRVRRLALCLHSGGDRDSAQQIISQGAETLEHLHLMFGSFIDDIPDLSQYLNLPRLRQLDITPFILEYGTTNFGQMGTWIEHLRQAGSVLENVNLRVRLGHETDVFDSVWSKLAAILSLTQIRALSIYAFLHEGLLASMNVDNARIKIESHFAHLHHRRVRVTVAMKGSKDMKNHMLQISIQFS